MILIADSGSTQTKWCLIQNVGEKLEISTDGINPFLQNEDNIISTLKQQLSDNLLSVMYNHIYFYGAGCATDNKKQIIRNALQSVFQSGSIEVESDLLAAARALLQNKDGIACILGTGSNSCFYDGTDIIKNVPPLGFILGDEGSGSALGKAFLADYLKGLTPTHISNLFYDHFHLSYEELLDNVYNRPYPNRFLASITLFLNKHVNEEYIRQLITYNFTLFIERNIRQYQYQNYPVYFTGSVAYYFKDILCETLSRYDILDIKIEKTPMNGLIKFHKAP